MQKNSLMGLFRNFNDVKEKGGHFDLNNHRYGAVEYCFDLKMEENDF